MKSLKEIQQEAEKGDYTRVAELVGKSAELVRKVVAGERVDLNNIQKTFSDMLEYRQRLSLREQKRIKKQTA